MGNTAFFTVDTSYGWTVFNSIVDCLTINQVYSIACELARDYKGCTVTAQWHGMAMVVVKD